MAHVEAVIDFGEDENIEEGLLPEGKWALLDPCCWICGIFFFFFSTVRERVGQLLKEVTAHLNDGRRGERLRSGVHVTIVGAPNAGKSSLLNILCRSKCTLFIGSSSSLSLSLPPSPLLSPFRSASCGHSLTTCWHYKRRTRISFRHPWLSYCSQVHL